MQGELLRLVNWSGVSVVVILSLDEPHNQNDQKQNGNSNENPQKLVRNTSRRSQASVIISQVKVAGALLAFVIRADGKTIIIGLQALGIVGDGESLLASVADIASGANVAVGVTALLQLGIARIVGDDDTPETGIAGGQIGAQSAAFDAARLASVVLQNISEFALVASVFAGVDETVGDQFGALVTSAAVEVAVDARLAGV